MALNYYKHELDTLQEILDGFSPSNPALQQVQTALFNQNLDNLQKQSLRNSSTGTIHNNNSKYPIIIQYKELKDKYINLGVNEYSIEVKEGNPIGPINSNVVQFINYINGGDNYIKIKKDKFTNSDSLRSFPTLKTLGYTTGGELGSGGDITTDLLNALKKLHTVLQKPKYKSINPITITGGNDLYHHNEDIKDVYSSTKIINTTHTRGIAIDVAAFENVLTGKNLLVDEALREAGFAYILFHDGTGNHTHANLPIN